MSWKLSMLKKFLLFVLGLALVGSVAYFAFVKYQAWQRESEAQEQAKLADGFDKKQLVDIAKKLSEQAYEQPADDLPEELKKLDYDQHRDIRFVRENGPWYNKSLPFEVQFFHLGSMFQISVPINEIVNGKVQPIKYSSNFFNYGKNKLDTDALENVGYAGFRLHYPLNTRQYYDELISFLGASYFRALAVGQKYGISARGLAIDTAVQTGEEFPIFKEFWLKRPKHNDQSVKIYALLDSPSVTGAYVFVITPGMNTTVKVDATLFPRKDINKLGVAPLTSMYLFGENSKNKFDDHRPEVHDSDGLLIWNGNDEWLWRPLDNSKYLRISSFSDNNPKGFGLMQRDRNPEHYLDFEAMYEQRPSVWVEPLENWGKGVVQLVEIPSIQEIHDNIVAYWIPDKKIKAGKEYHFSYMLHWVNRLPVDNGMARVMATYTGVGGVSGMLENEKRKFVVDFQNIKVKNLKQAIEKDEVKANISVSEGTIKGHHLMYNPLTGGALLYMDFKPNGKTSEIRMSLTDKNGKNLSEVWSYQWLP